MERSFPLSARPLGMTQPSFPHLLRRLGQRLWQAFWRGLSDFFDAWAAMSPDYVTFWGPNPDAWLAHIDAPEVRR